MAREALTARAQRLRIALAVPPLLAIFLLGQGILDARGIRLDLTPERRYTLSDHAIKILDGLPADVRILAFLRSQDPRNQVIDNLLRQVERHTPRVSVQRLEVNRHPALAREYGVDSYGALVVESDGRRRVFSNPREEVLMAALLQVTRQQRKTIGWVVGHGEGALDETARDRGYSVARALLEQEYYEVRPISLIGDDVPPEVAVLIIAGPAKGYLPEELAALDRYLQRPGQALVMLDPFRAPELAAFLRRYDVDLPADVVLDPGSRLHGGEYLTMQIGMRRGDHPIIGPLDAPPLFSLTRSVQAVREEPELTDAVAFLRTSEQSWATRDPNVVRTGTPVFVTGRDRPGPVTVGMELAFRVVTPPGTAPRQGRLVVYGNSEFANNFFIEFLGNKDLFLNSVNWLAHERQSLASRPRTQQLGLQQFYLSEEQGDILYWVTAWVQPAFFAAIGLFLVWYRRRS
jgi:ABC-type uncharacterized transport system involved in gliding motility auxiliary subunit